MAGDFRIGGDFFYSTKWKLGSAHGKPRWFIKLAILPIYEQIAELKLFV
jgi:hypothetical protein